MRDMDHRKRKGMLVAAALGVLAAMAALPGPASAQFRPLQALQPFQTAAQRNLLLLLQNIQQRTPIQFGGPFLRRQDQQQVSAAPQRVVSFVNAQPPPQQRFEQQRAPVPEARQRPSNTTGQPQFLDPGVGRWVLNGDPSCLPCICEAASGCDETLGCDERGSCGPFLLSQRYWTLAGRPLLRGDSPDRPGASSDCLRDTVCAADAVRGYLDRFAQDCDGDRRVDCFDLARVHFQGPFNCRAPLQPPNDFSETFRRCWDASRQNS